MGKWKIKSKREAILEDGLWTLCSLGLYKVFECKSYEYIIEHIDSGEIKTVFAEDEYELGEIIADGEFDEDDDDEEVEKSNNSNDDDSDYDYSSSDDDPDDDDDSDSGNDNSNDDKDEEPGFTETIVSAVGDFFKSGGGIFGPLGDDDDK